jgi:hypothetical protein
MIRYLMANSHNYFKNPEILSKIIGA